MKNKFLISSLLLSSIGGSTVAGTVPDKEHPNIIESKSFGKEVEPMGRTTTRFSF
ncbi:hypothetical protein HCG69_06980 [Bacteroides sp. K03]|uniref:hypothetical protein n=1 Tax=Bacteroides sp. K03 TaxID=2718928 RepID=UPI001C8BCB39|nr:hypothetical protein [Bacteroides sp. K03]MBX9187825.1 hypothetical protein [Bacteroides sp. K03]